MNMLKKQVMIVFLVGVMSSLVFGQFNQAVWDTLTTDSCRNFLTQQAVGVNGYEQFHLVYLKDNAGGGTEICYRFYDMMAGISPEIMADSGDDIYNPVVASIMGDDVSEIAVAYERAGDIWACINTIPPGEWEFRNISNSEASDVSPTIAYGNYEPQAAWVANDGVAYKIGYARKDGDSTYSEIIEDSQLGEFGAGAHPFIVTYGNLPHIFYRGVNNGAYNIHHAYKTHPDSGWIFEYLETPNADDFSATAQINQLGDIYVAVSGNAGWGMPYHVYELTRDYDTGLWSPAALVTGAYSATNASILYRPGNQIFIASCGVSGNIYNGDVYISNNLSGSFETHLLANYTSVTQPVLSDVIGEYGVLVFDAQVYGEQNQSTEIVYYGPPMVGIAENLPLPVSTSLTSAYPNPFNSQVKLAFNIDHPGRVMLDIFDIAGRKVQSLIDGDLAAGRYQTTWNADNFASGMYFYRLTVADNQVTKKMLLLK
jgi:hypothetical protein